MSAGRIYVVALLLRASCATQALRHKVPLDKRWQLVICTGRRQHTGGTARDLVSHVVERTREK